MLRRLVASRVLYRGESLPVVQAGDGRLCASFRSGHPGPLLMFTPQMAAAKRLDWLLMTSRAKGTVNSFEEKGVLNTPPSEESWDLRHSVSRLI